MCPNKARWKILVCCQLFETKLRAICYARAADNELCQRGRSKGVTFCDITYHLYVFTQSHIEEENEIIGIAKYCNNVSTEIK